MLGAEFTIGVIVLLAVLAGVTSWGVVQIVRGAVRKYQLSKGNRKDPWWWNSVLRLSAVGVGAGVGALLAPGVWGVMIGTCAGILNTTMVAFVKSKLKKAGESAGLDLGHRGGFGDEDIDEDLADLEEIDREGMGH